MKERKIIFINGLWSHPFAVEWIKKQFEENTNMPVELFDYHDLLVEKTNNYLYLNRVTEKYKDLYGDESNNILIGHSHGGALSLILSQKLQHEKIIITNPAFRPWGVFRRIPIELNSIVTNKEHRPHFKVKYSGELEERKKYFLENFNLGRDLPRIYHSGTEALKTLREIKTSLLLIQSMKDEFISVSSSLQYYKGLLLPTESIRKNNEPFKELIKVENAEHAILEEEGVYPLIYKKIDTFIKRK